MGEKEKKKKESNTTRTYFKYYYRPPGYCIYVRSALYTSYILIVLIDQREAATTAETTLGSGQVKSSQLTALRCNIPVWYCCTYSSITGTPG